jgi:hypothetical protein
VRRVPLAPVASKVFIYSNPGLASPCRPPHTSPRPAIPAASRWLLTPYGISHCTVVTLYRETTYETMIYDSVSYVV